MLRINPFAAIRPPSHLAGKISSVPYDVVNTEEARQLAAGKPDSWLHVIRPEIDLPEGTDPHADEVYARAKENYDRLLDTGRLVRDAEPRLFVYRQVQNHVRQTGVVCCCHIDDYLNDVIRKHEKTRRDKEDDRTRLTTTLNANTGPVFLTYRPHAAIDRLVREALNARPLYHFDAPDHVTHTVWDVANTEPFVEAFAQVPVAYVADGHHRSASAARAGQERRAANPGHTGNEEYNWFLSVLFPSDHLHILAYNRVVHDLGGRSPEAVREALAEIGQLSATDQPQPDRPGVFCIYLDERWHRLELPPGSIDHGDPVNSLDVALLQERILEPLFGIVDVRTDERISFIGGVRGTVALEREVDAGRAAIAFSMYPTSIDQLLSVADAGLIMPPKSTWFEPKLRSGLFVHSLD